MVHINTERTKALIKHLQAGAFLYDMLVIYGIEATLQTSLDERSGTLMICCSAAPGELSALFEAMGLPYDVIDFHDGDHRTVAAYEVQVKGHPVAVVALEQKSGRRAVDAYPAMQVAA